MATRTRAADERKPPIRGFLYAIVNPLVMALLRAPFGRGLNRVMTVVSFTGRRSGRRFRTPVGYTHEGGTVTFIAHGPWWKNFRDGADVTLLLEGREQPGRATAIEDPAEMLAYLRRRIAELGGVKNARRLGITELDTSNDNPSDAELLHAVRGAGLVRVQL